MIRSFVILVCLVAGSVAGVAHATLLPNTLVRVQLKNYADEMRLIQSHSLDVAGVDIRKKQVDLLVNLNDLAWLKSSGFEVVYTEISRSNQSPDSRYQNPSKIESTLKQMAAAYPTLAQVVSIGKSLEGRDIWGVRITKNVGIEDPSKPHVFFNAMHHAREVMTSEIGLDIVDQLLSGYGKDEKITHWLDSYVVDVIPMFNVDGNNLVWTSNSMWRKNAHGGYGVDINRNYPYAWNSCNGSSSSRNAQDFHGDSAASEPETRVMMDYVSKNHPVFSISYHSYSEIVIYPYGCSGQRTETKEVVEKIGRELGLKLKTDDGRSTYTAGTAPELLYSVDGGDIDWLYAVGQVIPFVIEVNSSSQGFQPSYSKWRDRTVATQREGWRFLLSRMDGASVYGQIKDQNGVGLEKAQIRITDTQGKFNHVYRVNPKGYFNVILNPGKYQVKIEAEGYAASVQTLALKDVRTPLSLTLQKNP